MAPAFAPTPVLEGAPRAVFGERGRDEAGSASPATGGPSALARAGGTAPSGEPLTTMMAGGAHPAHPSVERRKAVRQYGLELASGLITEAAARAWLRTPRDTEWTEIATLRRQLRQFCPPGTPAWADPGLIDRVDYWLALAERHQLGVVSLRLEPCAALLQIRRLDEPHGVALLEEWQLGVTVYSYVDATASLQYRKKQLGEQTVISAVQAAQEASAHAMQEWQPGGARPLAPWHPPRRAASARVAEHWSRVTRFIKDWL
jgi:hypothetical protein